MERHPENAVAHFALSYVLRYGGMSQEAGQECDIALSLDPGNYQFRSCSHVFEELGNIERAMDFLQLDAGSTWAQENLPSLFERAGKTAEALESAKKIPGNDPFKALLIACLDPAAAPAELDKEVRTSTPIFFADSDPENRYWGAALMASCAKKDIAVRLLKSAIEGHYCAYTALQKDPLLAKLRDTPDFSQLLSSAKQCQDNFLAERSLASP